MCNNRLYCRIISDDRHRIGAIRFIAGNIPHNGLHESGFGIRIATRSYIITGVAIIDTIYRCTPKGREYLQICHFLVDNKLVGVLLDWESLAKALNAVFQGSSPALT